MNSKESNENLEFNQNLICNLVSGKNPPGTKPPVRGQGRVRVRLRIGLGLESEGFFPGGFFPRTL